MKSKAGSSSSIYQRIPAEFLAPISEKVPLNIMALVLPNKRKKSDGATGGEFSTTRYEDAIRKSQVSGQRFREMSFAKWELLDLPPNSTVEGALDAIEAHNLKLKKCIKIKLHFRDGCHILFERAAFGDPDTLLCKTLHDPRGASRSKPEPASPPSFTVNDRGHLNVRSRNEDGSPKQSSFSPIRLPRIETATQVLDPQRKPITTYGFPMEPPGTVGFSFTPVGTISRMPRRGEEIKGVRHPIGSTSPHSFQILRPRLAEETTLPASMTVATGERYYPSGDYGKATLWGTSTKAPMM